jgi:hypothetical protein
MFQDNRRQSLAGIVALLALLSALALPGCSVNSAESAGPRPSNWRELVREHVRATWYDPHSLRDAMIALPVEGTFNFQTGWVICFRANGKNRFGAYTGLRTMGYLVRGGAVVAQAEQVHRCQRTDVHWLLFEMG